MFGLFRTVFLISLAFIAGVVFERGQVKELCEASGGTQTRGLCVGVTK